MTAYTKIAISIPLRAAERVRHAVRTGKAPSVSAYIAEAVEQRAKLDDLAMLLVELLAETGGPLTAAERRAADRQLGMTRPRRRSRR